VVASVLVMHPGKLNQAPPGVNQQVATTAPAVSGAQIASSPAPTSIDQPVAGLAETAKTGEALAKQEVHESKKLYARSSMPRSTPAQSPMLFADNKMESAPGIPAAPPPAESLVLPSATNQVTTENAEVAEAPRDAAMPVPLAEGALMARNEAPVEKAKPAPQEIEAMDQQKDQPRTDLEKSKLAASLPAAKSPARAVTSSGAKLAGPQTNVKAVWAIAAGTLQRSLDSGQNWQNALRADRPLLCFAVQGKDVWAGGEAGTLFHSTDSGGTWVQVQPSIESRQLRSDITHIVLRNVVLRNDEGHFDDAHGSEDITVSTSNNQVWTSTDGGKTWQKQ